MNLGLGLGLRAMRPLASGPAAIDPATQTLTLWERASFGGSPWAGTASAGNSGSRSLTTSGVAPSVGSALNGLNPADFNGSTQGMTYTGTLATVLAATGYTYSVLVLPRGGAAAAGTAYFDQQIIGDSGAVLGLCWSTSGVSAWHDTGAAGIKFTPWTACTANAWHWVDARYDGTNLKCRVDGGTWSSIAAGNPPSLAASSLRLGRNYNPVYTSMAFAELMTWQSVVPDATLAGLRAYGNARYGLAL